MNELNPIETNTLLMIFQTMARVKEREKKSNKKYFMKRIPLNIQHFQFEHCFNAKYYFAVKM